MNMQFTVKDMQLQDVSTIELADDVFAVEPNDTLVWEQVLAQRASQRRGTHKTKKRGEVSGGGAKPFKQKGTGRARQGSTRSPLNTGGGTVWGPQPRDYSYRLPRSARRAALKSALSIQFRDEKLVVLDALTLAEVKTKHAADFVALLGHPKTLVIDVDNGVYQRAFKNLPRAKFLLAEAANTLDILNHERVVLTVAAVELVVAKARGQKLEAEETAAAA